MNLCTRAFYTLMNFKENMIEHVTRGVLKTFDRSYIKEASFEKGAEKELNEYSSKLKEYEMIVKLLSVR